MITNQPTWLVLERTGVSQSASIKQQSSLAHLQKPQTIAIRSAHNGEAEAAWALDQVDGGQGAGDLLRVGGAHVWRNPPIGGCPVGTAAVPPAWLLLQPIAPAGEVRRGGWLVLGPLVDVVHVERTVLAVTNDLPAGGQGGRGGGVNRTAVAGSLLLLLLCESLPIGVGNESTWNKNTLLDKSRYDCVVEKNNFVEANLPHTTWQMH